MAFNIIKRDSPISLGISSFAAEQRMSPDSPAMPLGDVPAIFSFLGGDHISDAGELISERNALQIVTVMACVRVLAESVASLPLKVYSITPTGRQEAVDAALYNLLAYSPNSEMTAFTFFETLVGCLALTGNGYAQIERSVSGSPIALWPLHPLKTEPVRDAQGNLCYRTSDGMQSGKARVIPAADVLHIPLFGWDGTKGLSPIQQAAQALGLTRAAERFGSKYFGNGSKPGGVLSYKGSLDAKQRAEARESWQATQGGRNQGRTAILAGEWSYQQLGLSPEDSQFLATRQFQRAEICALFRVPPHMAGDTTRLSNGNHEQQSLQFVTDTLRPYLGRIEQEIARKLLPKQGRSANKYIISFDVSERLRGDFQTTMQGLATGRQWGAVSANEFRKALGMNPGGPELDVYLTPVNMQNAARLLDTESIQDQPIGNDPADSAPQQRALFDHYRRCYFRTFRDAFGRLQTRNKRDLTTISQVFEPVLRSIADFALDHNSADIAANGALAEQVVTDVLRSIEKRSLKWVPVDDSELQQLIEAEFGKATRAIHIQVARQIAAANASKQLSSGDFDAE